MEIAEKNLEKALGLGIMLTLLPKNEDTEKEEVFSWMRTTGLMVLGQENLKTGLDEYLENGKLANDLCSVLISNINLDVSHVKSKRDTDGNPNGYSCVQSIYIGFGLKDSKNPRGRSIYENAAARKSEIADVIAIYKTISDCSYLAERI